jgi:hypothetical protein
MVPRAPSVVAPLLVFRPDWKTLVRLASTRSKPLDLDSFLRRPPSVSFVAQPTNRNPLRFEAQTKNCCGDFEA